MARQAHASVGFDRTREDVGNVQLLEHVNLTVADQGIAALFYVTGLGFTRDPYIDFGTSNMWVNAGDTQFHLPKNTSQKLRGHIGVVVPDLEGLSNRLEIVGKSLAGTQFAWQANDDHIRLSCPWGNDIRAFPAGAIRGVDLGIAWVELLVRAGTTPGIAQFYRQVLGCPVGERKQDRAVDVHMGTRQRLVFRETDEPIADYDGHHIAIYVANFSGPHAWLEARGLISEESSQTQYRFEKIVDPESGEVLTEIEHEVRSLSHAMYRRPLVNRNPSTSVSTYRRGNEQFVPA